MTLNKRTTNALKKLAKAALDSDGGEKELNKLAIKLATLGFLDGETAASSGEDHDTALQRFQRIQSLKKDLRAEAARIARSVLEDRAQSIFESHPDVESFGWRQSTPTETQEYGYDGFMIVHSSSPFINGEEAYTNPRDKDGTAANAVGRTVAYVIRPTELQDMFGDGAHVTIKRDLTIEHEHWWPPDC